MRTLWILWGSFISSLAFYAGAAFGVSRQGLALSAPGLLPVLVPLFIAMAVMNGIFLVLFFPRLAGKMDYAPYCILRWALADAIGIYGLVLFVLGASWETLGVFVGGAFLLNVFFRPSRGDQETFDLAHRGGR